MSKKEEKKGLLQRLGPGFITGASDDDPSGIATYAQTGAMFGYSQLWMAVFAAPLMIAVQEVCGRIGMVTGKGIAGAMRDRGLRAPLLLAVVLLVAANTVNIAANLAAMAEAAALLMPAPMWIWLIGIASVTLILQLTVRYNVYEDYLKIMAFSLLAYVVAFFIVKHDWTDIAFHTFVPSFTWSQDFMMNIVAILGTTIAPYLFFWEADEEAEEQVQRKRIPFLGALFRPKVDAKDLRDMRIDTAVGMIFSNIIMFCIITVTADTMWRNGIHHIGTAAEAAKILEPLAGSFASLLFALGIIGTGLLVVPILAGASGYAVAEAMQWKEGLSLTARQAPGFYGVISAAIFLGVLLTTLDIPPFELLYTTAVLNGLLAPPLLACILWIGSDKKTMGEFTTPPLQNAICWCVVALMSLAGVALFSTMLMS